MLHCMSCTESIDGAALDGRIGDACMVAGPADLLPIIGVLHGDAISDDAIDHDASCFTCESRDTSTAAWMTDDGWPLFLKLSPLFLKLSLFFLKDETGDAISDDSIDQHPGCCMNWPWELKSTGSKSGN